MKLNLLGGRVSVFAGLGVAALIFSAGAVVTSMLPRTYLSSARFVVDGTRPEPEPAADTLPPSATVAPDPFELEKALELTRSMEVLNRVATRLDLAKIWGPTYLGTNNATIAKWLKGQPEIKLEPAETVAILQDKVEVRRFRNTSMIEVRVHDRDPVLAARIANGIVEVLKEIEARSRPRTAGSIALVDSAEPGLRPIRPNVPLNLVMAGLVGLLLGGLVMLFSALMHLLLRHHRSRTAPAK